jgi:hypothetical protein
VAFSIKSTPFLTVKSMVGQPLYCYKGEVVFMGLKMVPLPPSVRRERRGDTNISLQGSPFNASDE